MVCIICNQKEARKRYLKCNRCCKYGGNGWEVYKRDNFTCQGCDKKENEVKRLEIHHIDGKGSSLPVKEQNNNIDNLILLCPKCHDQADAIVTGVLKWHKSGRKPNLNKGLWVGMYKKCVQCGKTDSKRVSLGLYNRCYVRNSFQKRRLKNPQYWRTWKSNNPLYKEAIRVTREYNFAKENGLV